MVGTSRRSWARIAAVAGIVITVALAFAFWRVALNGSDADAEGALVDQARATLTARAAVPGATSTLTQPATARPSPTLLPAAAGPVCQADQLATELAAGVPFNGQIYPDWYTAEESNLWAAPLHYGTYTPAGFSRPTSPWFAHGATTINWYGTATPIVLSGTQLDGDAVLGPIDPGQMNNQLQWTDFAFPEPGCWTLTGTAGEETLEITVDVLPIDQRLDLILIESFYEARPYEAPETCAISPWTGPDIRADSIGSSDHRFPVTTGPVVREGSSTFARYWLESDGIAAQVPGLFIADRQQNMGVLGTDVEESLTVRGRKADSSQAEAFEATTTIWNGDARLAAFRFPSPGCWELTMATPTETESFIVFVYPEECEPRLREGGYISSCQAP